MGQREIREAILALVWVAILAVLVSRLDFALSIVLFGVLFAGILLFFSTSFRRWI